MVRVRSVFYKAAKSLYGNFRSALNLAWGNLETILNGVDGYFGKVFQVERGQSLD